MTEAQFKAELERLKLRAPRVGVKSGRVFRDKTKYSRKNRNRDDLEQET